VPIEVKVSAFALEGENELATHCSCGHDSQAIVITQLGAVRFVSELIDSFHFALMP
jgi:hypothetical protein